MHEGGGRWGGSNKLVELKKKKESTCNVGDPGSVPWSEISPGEGYGNPIQHSCLENAMDGGAWRATVCGVGHD